MTLKDIRIDRGLSQEQLAQMAGISPRRFNVSRTARPRVLRH